KSVANLLRKRLIRKDRPPVPVNRRRIPQVRSRNLQPFNRRHPPKQQRQRHSVYPISVDEQAGVALAPGLRQRVVSVQVIEIVSGTSLEHALPPRAVVASNDAKLAAQDHPPQ